MSFFSCRHLVFTTESCVCSSQQWISVASSSNALDKYQWRREKNKYTRLQYRDGEKGIEIKCPNVGSAVHTVRSPMYCIYQSGCRAIARKWWALQAVVCECGADTLHMSSNLLLHCSLLRSLSPLPTTPILYSRTMLQPRHHWTRLSVMGDTRQLCVQSILSSPADRRVCCFPLPVGYPVLHLYNPPAFIQTIRNTLHSRDRLHCY